MRQGSGKRLPAACGSCFTLASWIKVMRGASHSATKTQSLRIVPVSLTRVIIGFRHNSSHFYCSQTKLRWCNHSGWEASVSDGLISAHGKVRWRPGLLSPFLSFVWLGPSLCVAEHTGHVFRRPLVKSNCYCKPPPRRIISFHFGSRVWSAQDQMLFISTNGSGGHLLTSRSC